MKKIMFIVGSMRKNSFNRQLSLEIAKILSEKAEISWLSYEDIPYMNQDKEYPAPAEVKRVRDEITAMDGIWIVTPEYNSSYPGVLKNLLDWLSRPLIPRDPAKVTAVSGKKVTISGAAGKSAAEKSMAKLTELLGLMQMNILPDFQTGISLGAENFGSDCLNLAEQDKKAIENQALAFLAFLED